MTSERRPYPAEALVQFVGRDWVGRSVHAQAPRQVEPCAVLGRNPVWRGDCDPREFGAKL